MSERIVRDGWVISTEGEWLVVQVGRPDACGHCAASGVCTAFSNGAHIHQARARNLCCATPGQHVRLEMDAGPLLITAFFVYFFPALTMLVLAVVGHQLAPQMAWSSDVAAAMGALIALVLWALVLVVYKRRQPNHPLLRAVEVLDDTAPCPPPKV